MHVRVYLYALVETMVRTFSNNVIHFSEYALMTANMMPALMPRQAEHPELPYVFDTRVHVKQTAAYILGAKITLPVDVVNDSKPGYEEYTFPATKQIPPEWTDKFLDISEMDEIGQIAFKGIKKV